MKIAVTMMMNFLMKSLVEGHPSCLQEQRRRHLKVIEEDDMPKSCVLQLPFMEIMKAVQFQVPGLMLGFPRKQLRRTKMHLRYYRLSSFLDFCQSNCFSANYNFKIICTAVN